MYVVFFVWSKKVEATIIRIVREKTYHLSLSVLNRVLVDLDIHFCIHMKSFIVSCIFLFCMN